MVIGDILTINALHFPEKTALITEQGHCSYALMNEESNRIANALLARGAKEGQRVAILARTSAQAIQAIFGVAKSGAALVMLNNLLRPRELEFILHDCQPTFLIVDEAFLQPVLSLADKLYFIKEFLSLGEGKERIISFNKWAKESTRANPVKKVGKEAIFNLLYTAGTTGVPKAAIYTHGGFYENLLSTVIDTPGQGYDEIWLGPIPLYHIGGFATVIRAFLMSNTLILYNSFDPLTFLKTIERERVTILYAYPTMIHALVNHPEVDLYDYSSLRLIIYGGSAMPLATLKKAFTVFPCDFLQRYGSTECCGSAISILSPRDHRLARAGDEQAIRRLTSAGRPALGTMIKLVDEEGHEVTEPGAIGEIVVKLSAPMEGYWQRPEDTREALRDGWFYTGDLGKKDAGGYLYIVDRKKDMIISGARNIYPREIEELLLTHPDILEAAVIGVPDEYWGESVKAIITLRPGRNLSSEEVIAFCKENLASYKKPRFVEFAPSLPKNPGGKIDKKELRRLYGSRGKSDS